MKTRTIIPFCLLLSLRTLVSGDIWLHEYGSFMPSEIISMGNCTDNSLVILTGDGGIAKAKASEGGFSSVKRIAGPGSSLIPEPLYGVAVLCTDTSTFFIRSTTMVRRIHNGVLDTLSTGDSEIIGGMVPDDSGSVLFENYNWIYKAGAEGPATKIRALLPGYYSQLKGFAAQDDKNMVAVMIDSGVYYVKEGIEKKIPLSGIPQAARLVSIVRFGKTYVIADIDGSPFQFDLSGEKITRITNRSTFSYGNGNGYPLGVSVYDGVPLFCSHGNIQSLQSGEMLSEIYRRDSDSSVFTPEFLFSITTLKTSRTFIGGMSGVIYELGKIDKAPVSMPHPPQTRFHTYRAPWHSDFQANGRKLGPNTKNRF